MNKFYAIGALVLAFAMVGGVAIAVLWEQMTRPEDQFAECRATRVAGGSGDIGGPFELISETGETVTDADVITGPSLLYFGYTFCPDVCPLDNARNAVAIDILQEQGQMVTPIFISVDPDRDTPDQLQIFTDNMHPRMLGLTGSRAQIDAAVSAYRSFYRIQDTENEDYYLVDHFTLSYLVFPEHGFVEFFRNDETPDEMAQRIGCFVDAAT